MEEILQGGRRPKALAEPAALRATALSELILMRRRSDPSKPAVGHWEDGTLRVLGWGEVDRQLEAAIAALKGLVPHPGGRVALLFPTSYLWSLLDWACLSAGVVSIACHPDWSPSQLAQALAIAPPDALLCAPDQHGKVLAAMAETGMVFEVRVLSGSKNVERLTDDERPAEPGEAKAVRAEIPHVSDRSDLTATVVFTSGTSGMMGAVELSQQAMLLAARESYLQLGFDLQHQPTLHWLPLAHMFGRLGTYIDLVAGSVGHYGRGAAALAEDLAVVRPPLLFAVPKVLARLRQRIEERVGQAKPSRRALFSVIHGTGRIGRYLPIPLGLSFQERMRSSLLASVHRPLGGRLACVVVGSAPVDPQAKQWFEALGVAVREGFGMTETAGVASVQPYRRRSHGAGPLIPSVNATVDTRGQLLLAGRSLFLRRLPGGEREQDESFETGDLARIDRDGCLVIHGRIKDTVITESGENVAPAPIEARLADHPWIDEVCLIGNGRPCLIALLALSDEGRSAVQRQGLAAIERALVEHRVTVNGCLSKFQRVHGQVIVQNGFSHQSGELTVTRKKRRNEIADRHAIAIDACYRQISAGHQVPNARRRLDQQET